MKAALLWLLAFEMGIILIFQRKLERYLPNSNPNYPIQTLRQPMECNQEVLDKLDEQFDQQRSERQRAMDTNMGNKLSFDLYEPEATCFSEERFGSDIRYRAFGDGPKFTCGVDFIAQSASNSSCLVYSVGSNNDISFEKAVHTFMGCEIHTFDPTLKTAFVGEEYSTFHPWGLGKDGAEANRGKKSWVGKSFETIIKELGHENRPIDVLKIDCEGCEYDVLPPLFELISTGKVQVNQVLVELHIHKLRGANKLRELFSGADKAHLRIFHKERNGWGCKNSKCVEYSFASEAFLHEVNRASICPAH